MTKLIKISYRYNHPTKRYNKSNRAFIITNYAYMTLAQIKQIEKLFTAQSLSVFSYKMK